MAHHLLYSFLIIGAFLVSFVTEGFAEENAASHRSITFPTDPFLFNQVKARKLPTRIVSYVTPPITFTCSLRIHRRDGQRS